MGTGMVADFSAHAPVAYNYEKRCHFSVSPISRDVTVDKGKPPVNTQFFEQNVPDAALNLSKVSQISAVREINTILKADLGPSSA